MKQYKSVNNRPQTLRAYLIRGASGSLVFKIGSTAFGLLMAVVLARVLGIEQFGIYAFCLSIVQILTVPAMLGGQNILIREVAAYQAKGEFHFLRGLLTRFRQASFLVSLILSLIAACFGYFFYRGGPMQTPFLLATCLVPLYAAIQLQDAGIMGLRYILLGQAAQTFRPALFIMVVGGVFWYSGKDLKAEAALLAQILVSGVLFITTFFILRHVMPPGAKSAKPGYEMPRWTRSMIPFVFAGSMQILSSETSVVVLGILLEPKDVGLFRVAQRGAMIIPFGLHAVNMAIAPIISELYANHEMKRLQQVISKSIVAVLAFALPATTILILGGRWLIPLVFGADFSPAYVPLVILCFGQLVNSGMGSVGLTLNMVGLERFTARGVAIAAAISIVLNVVLVPRFGVSGAAIATTCSLITWNVLLFIWLYRETGIISTFFPSQL